MPVFDSELDTISTTFFRAEIFSVETQPCEHSFRRGLRVQFHLKKQPCELSLRVCSHNVFSPRIARVLHAQNASNYASITSHNTPGLNLMKNMRVCSERMDRSLFDAFCKRKMRQSKT